MNYKSIVSLKGMLLCSIPFFAQIDSTQIDSLAIEDEIDFSMYDDLSFADESAKRYCTPKIFSISPQKLISIGWQRQGSQRLDLSPSGAYQEDDAYSISDVANMNHVSGIKLGANIPTVSNNKIIWQLGFNYAESHFSGLDNSNSLDAFNGIKTVSNELKLALRTLDLNTTIFKPLNETSFIIFQGSAAMSGNYVLPNFQSLAYNRYSTAVLWGKKPSDYKQWAIGIARTYKVGELNYIPIAMFNYTAPNRKWGTEVLFPARAHYRRTFSSRSLLLAGFTLEGQSYRLNGISNDKISNELRRGEVKLGLEYQKQLKGFLWMSAQAGYRFNYSFNVDSLEEGNDFFRGFFGEQEYRNLGTITNPLYFNVGIHLVSP